MQHFNIGGTDTVAKETQISKIKSWTLARTEQDTESLLTVYVDNLVDLQHGVTDFWSSVTSKLVGMKTVIQKTMKSKPEFLHKFRHP